ncbi:O-antigen ligase family protein [Clostridium vincentii]|uniref:O-Antigen ligase n=1 Tax=Clostridium vincentii TaxID=52704 RepID=A0A2T0BGU2_9CLOT|nr:O-antigen ligase family protein [Clostridium vincentii]PRR83042.1 O-Antigen ligase [Clostridium vincentii]
MLKKLYSVLSNNFYFCLFYLFASLSFVTILNEIPYINLLSKVALVWGLALSVVHIIKIIKRYPTLIELSLYIFLGFTLIINLIFYRSIENLKIWLVTFIILSSVFYINLDKSHDQLEKELKIISNFIAIFTFIFSLASTIMYFANITFTFASGVYGVDQGLYIYKNSLAISASIGLLVSVYMSVKYKYEKTKFFHLLNVMLQIIPLVFSNGISAYLLIITILFVLIFIKFKNKIFRSAMILVPSIFSIAGFALFHEKLYDFLSGRNELWSSAWLSIKENPLFGVGNEALVSKVDSMRPGVVLPGIDSGGLHNMYLQIITVNGVIALILFLIFIYFIFIFLIKKLDRSYGIYKRSGIVLLSLLVGILFINLFESNLIYIVSFISIIFWIYLGYFLSLTFKKNH